MKPFTTIAVLIFAVICVVHIVRFFSAWPVRINNLDVPVWISVVGALVFGLLAFMLWRENKR
jgi:uncharacterized membrane protein YhhN